MPSFRLRLRVSGTGTYTDGARDQIAAGVDTPDLSVAMDAAAGETWQQVVTTLTIAASGNVDIDLANAANTLKDRLNRPLNLATLYFFAAAIVSPNGTKKVKVGPLGQSNAFLGWFADASDGETVDAAVVRQSRGGWAVTAGTGDMLRVNNPTGGSVSVTLWLAGKQ